MTCTNVLDQRDRMSKIWHSNWSISLKMKFSGFKTQERYDSFCVAKDLIQDTGEAMLHHRRRGFRGHFLDSCVELWGILQAVVIQQDAILELQFALTGNRDEPNRENYPYWYEIRDFRNLASGHPARQGSNKHGFRSCVANRGDISYSSITVKIRSNEGSVFRQFDLGSLIDRYDDEAATIMSPLVRKLENQIESS